MGFMEQKIEKNNNKSCLENLKEDLENLKEGSEFCYKIPRDIAIGYSILDLFYELGKKFPNEPFIPDLITIIQELWDNVQKHGKGDNIDINVKLSDKKFFFSVNDETKDIFNIREQDGRYIFMIQAEKKNDQETLNQINQKINEHFSIEKIELTKEETKEEYVLNSKGTWPFKTLDVEVEDKKNIRLEDIEKLLESGRGWGLINRLMVPTDELIISLYKDGTAAIGINIDREAKRAIEESE